MGWFNEQIKERVRRDEEDLADAMEEIGSIITRKQPELGTFNRAEDQEESITDAIRQILQTRCRAWRNSLNTIAVLMGSCTEPSIWKRAGIGTPWESCWDFARTDGR